MQFSGRQIESLTLAELPRTTDMDIRRRRNSTDSGLKGQVWKGPDTSGEKREIRKGAGVAALSTTR